MKVEDGQTVNPKDQLPRILTNTTDDFEMRVRAYNMVKMNSLKRVYLVKD